MGYSPSTAVLVMKESPWRSKPTTVCINACTGEIFGSTKMTYLSHKKNLKASSLVRKEWLQGQSWAALFKSTRPCTLKINDHN